MIQDDRLPLKEEFLSYLEDVPTYKFASKHIKKSEDTTKRWRVEDPDFDEQCNERISRFVRRVLKRTKPEFQLERLFKKDFSERKELTGKDGKDLPTPLLTGVIDVPSNDSTNKTK